MRLADFDFELPPDRIAQHPARPRDAARLLHVARGDLVDCMVRDLPALLRPGDVLVVNDTRVIPAQLTARRGEARIGITLDQPRPDGAWHALARNARRLHVGDELHFDGGGELRATVVERDADGGVALAFNQRDADFAEALRRAGALALPPYIARPTGPLPEDEVDYQTIFAAHEGAVAAPTAGLHFTPALLRGAGGGVDAGASPSRCMSARAPSCRCAATTSPSTTCMPNAARSRRTPPPRSMRRARRAGAWSPSAPPASGCWKARRPRTAASARSPATRRCSSCRAIGSARSICC